MVLVPETGSRQRGPLVNKIQSVSNGTHRKVETRSRVSSSTSTPRLGKIPSVDVLERFGGRSTVAAGRADERFKNSCSGEKQRASDTTIRNQNKGSDVTALPGVPATPLSPSHFRPVRSPCACGDSLSTFGRTFTTHRGGPETVWP